MELKNEKLTEEIFAALFQINYDNPFDRLICSSEEKVLWAIAEAGGTMNPKQLSNIMNVTMPRVTTLLNGMDKKGLITRTVAGDDRRKIDVTITRKGKEANRKVARRTREYVDKITEQLTEDEVRAVIKYLNLNIEFNK